MYKLRRKLYSQNFIVSRKLVEKLLVNSSISKLDSILEIGPGKGIITEQLLIRSKSVIAVEIDKNLYKSLQTKFSDNKNLSLFNCDFLDFQLPNKSYKVFANIPFAIEGKIIRKMIESNNPPDDCYLVLDQKLATRLIASYQENLFSLLHKPWFDFSIPYVFKPTDFTPVPNVKIVLFRFKKDKIRLYLSLKK